MNQIHIDKENTEKGLELEVEERVNILGEDVKVSDIYSVGEKESKFVEIKPENEEKVESGRGLTVPTR